jgi:hypothetical protein
MITSIATRRTVLHIALAGLVVPVATMAPRRVHADALSIVDVWKDASCDCCEGWVRHMRDAGFNVFVHNTSDMAGIKQARGVPIALQSCHTAVVSGYVEGHVPASDIKRLIAEHPSATGLAVRGMPQSAPGMDQPSDPYTVLLFGVPYGVKVYAQH